MGNGIDCTCGSGMHPRYCSKHPDGYIEHIIDLNHEGGMEYGATICEEEDDEVAKALYLDGGLTAEDYLAITGEVRPSWEDAPEWSKDDFRLLAKTAGKMFAKKIRKTIEDYY